MLLLKTLACFLMLLQTLLSTPLLGSKPKPVDLKYTCMEVIEPINRDFKHDDVPVIMLHGFTMYKESWHGVYEIIALATKKKVCIVDLRNHGESPWVDEEFDVVAMTEDIKHLIEQIKAPKAIVLGHSLGGRVACNLATTYPEKVEKIIVEDMRPNGGTPEGSKADLTFFRVLKELIKSIPQGVSEKEAKEQFALLFKEQAAKMNVTLPMDDPALIPVMCSKGKCKLSFNPVLVDVALRNVDEVLHETSGRFDGPALFIYGTESELKVGEDESNIKKIFPNAKLVPVEGANHLVHAHKKFTTEVIKFINE